MTTERMEVVWLEARSDYTVTEVIELSGLPPRLVEALVECGALPIAGDRRFEAESIVLARAARRLHDSFELDDQGLALAISLLRRVRVLEALLVDTRARSGPRPG